MLGIILLSASVRSVHAEGNRVEKVRRIDLTAVVVLKIEECGKEHGKGAVCVTYHGKGKHYIVVYTKDMNDIALELTQQRDGTYRVTWARPQSVM